MTAPGERRPPIGPVLASIADLFAAWWLGFETTEASEPPDDLVPDDISELTDDDE